MFFVLYIYSCVLLLVVTNLCREYTLQMTTNKIKACHVVRNTHFQVYSVLQVPKMVTVERYSLPCANLQIFTLRLLVATCTLADICKQMYILNIKALNISFHYSALMLNFIFSNF